MPEGLGSHPFLTGIYFLKGFLTFPDLCNLNQCVQVLSQLGIVNNNKINLIYYFIVKLCCVGADLDHFGVY